MTKLLLAFTALALTYGQTTFAATAPNLDLYHRLIEAQRDSSGTLVQLILKPAAELNSTGASNITSVLRDRLQKLNERPSLMTDNMQTLTKAGWSENDIKNYHAAKNIISSSHEVQHLLDNKIVNKILREFQKDVNLIFQFQVLAKPNAPGYFHDRALINKALKKALSAAENALGTTPALRAVTFLLNTALGWVEEKQSYTQNILLFYMEKMPASSLGFTDQEISLIKSSIFERQIAWWDFKKLQEATKHWSTYGTERFQVQISDNASRLEKYGSSHGEILNSLNFAFTVAQKDNVSYILNTQDPKSKTSKDLSTAYDGKAPRHIRDFRIELELVQLASSFLPVPGFVLGQLNGLISSYYKNQKITEGALFAYLAGEDEQDQAGIILDQSINPILIHDLK